MSGADPRVKVAEGPHPNQDAVRRLVEDVHGQLDMLGVPRFVAAGPLTLLGRMAEWLDADAGLRRDDGQPVPGQLWGRGPRPTVGTKAQLCAWLQAVPCNPCIGQVIEVDRDLINGGGTVTVNGYGLPDEVMPGLGGLRRYTLEAFTAKWWRP